MGNGAPSLTRNMLFNVGGIVLPLAAAIVAVPVLINHLGIARFGILALMHAALSYAALLDFGLGAALVYRLSSLLRRENAQTMATMWMRSSLALVMLSGVVGAAIIWVTAPHFSIVILGPASPLVFEAMWSVRLLSLSIPAVLVAGILCGILAAHGRFDEINKIRIPLGVFSYLGPAVGSLVSGELYVAVAILLLIRLAAAVAHIVQCRNVVPRLWAATPCVSASSVRPLLNFGGWLSVSNVIGPIMVYLDRFYIGAVLSVDHVARYVTPYEIATKIQLIPAAILPVMFPLFVAQWARSKTMAADTGFAMAILMATFCAIPAALMAALAPEILGLWLGEAFLGESVAVLQVLAGGVFVNCLAQVFLLQIQGFGRTDVIAKFHVAELVGYVCVLTIFTARYGIVGVALAWVLRVFVDGCLLCWRASLELPQMHKVTYWAVYAGAVGFGVTLGLLAFVDSLPVRVLVLVAPVPVAWIFRARLMRLWAIGLSTDSQRTAAEAL